MSVKDTISKLEKESKNIWMNRPRDIKLLKGRKGAKNRNLNIILYAETDVSALTEGMHILRATTLENNCDIKTIGNLGRIYLESYASRYARYFHMETLSELVSEAAKAFEEVNNIGELRSLIEATETFVGKMWSWIDREIPYELLKNAYISKYN